MDVLAARPPVRKRPAQPVPGMAAKRRAVLDTATSLFAENGYRAVGIDRIIAESGAAKMTMYRHFPSKSQLIVEVLKEHGRMRQFALEGAVAGSDDAHAQLKAVFEWYDASFRDPAFSGCLFTRAVAEFNDRSHQIHQLSVEQKLQETQFLQAILERLVSQHQAAALARVFIMLLDGATLTAQINGPEAAATEAWSAAERLLAVAGATR